MLYKYLINKKLVGRNHFTHNNTNYYDNFITLLLLYVILKLFCLSNMVQKSLHPSILCVGSV